MVRACLRLGVIGGSSIAALACASRLWTGHGVCSRRSDELAVAAVRRRSPLALAEEPASECFATVPPLEGGGFRCPSLEDIERVTRTPQRWKLAWEVAKTYDFRNFASAEKRAKCLVGNYIVVAESEAPLAPTCTCPDFAKRGPICKHAAGLYLWILSGHSGTLPAAKPEWSLAAERAKRRRLRGTPAAREVREGEEVFVKAAQDLRGALAEAVVEDGWVQRPRSSPPRNGRSSFSEPKERRKTMEGLSDPNLWNVQQFLDANKGLSCWLQQLSAAGRDDRVQCLFYTLDHPELVGALRDAGGRGACVQVIVDREYLQSNKCKGMRGAVKALALGGAAVRQATGAARPLGGFRGIHHCKAVYSEADRRRIATLSAGSLNATKSSQSNEEFVASGPLTVAGREARRIRFDAIFASGVECGVAVREIAGYARAQ